LPGDPSWDALFYSAGRLVDDGWTAEIAIPFKSLRYPSGDDGYVHRWGFQIQREIQGKNELDVWSPVSRDVIGFLGQMGVLEGMTNLSTSRNLEILPTATAISSSGLDATTGERHPGNVREGGVSLKYGITSNLTLDFTYNPDFSQIESDRQQIAVNQRFPLFYPELRPFFLEGQEIFNIPGPVTLVHTRTIIDPQYGGKLTGKVGKTTVGFLVANDEAPGHVDDPSDPAFNQKATNVYGRARYDLYSESSLGVIVTDREFMDQYSRVGGMDGQFKLGRSQRVSFRAVGSQYRDIAALESNGHIVDAAYRKEGRKLGYAVFYDEISPGFKTDSGFVQRVDERQAIANVFYRWWPQNWIVNHGPRFSYNRNHEFSGILQDHGINVGYMAQFARNIFFNVGTDRDMERYLKVDFDKVRYNFGGGVNASRKISVGGFGSVGDQIRYVTDPAVPYLGRGSNYNLFVTVKPISRLQSELNLQTSDFYNVTTESKEFDIKIYRLLTTYQFTNRMLVRNILDYDNYAEKFGVNVLFTYRVNSGTVFFVGYDDRYQQANLITDSILTATDYTRTNRAVFAKLQVLFRY